LNKGTRLFNRVPGPAVLPRLHKISVPAADDRDRTKESVVPAVHRPSYLIEPIHTLLLDRFAPASVLVNREGQIVYVHGQTGAYLEPAQGLASQNVVDMAREGLRGDLAALLQRVEKKPGPVMRKGLRVPTHGQLRMVTLSVTPLDAPAALQGLLLITFETERLSPAAPQAGKKAARNNAVATKSEDPGVVLELQYTQQRLQRSIEELQQSNEEFKSTNEELQSTNEELQSTNEEMETSKEELQSLNEELQTVNAELNGKLEELADTNDDLDNLMNSTEVATVFLDSEMRIKRFTPEAARISKVIESDIGRPFSDIVSTVRYDGLMEDARAVLKTLIIKEREVKATDGRWYQLRMFPYRTAKNVIDGLVLTYLNITESKLAAQAASEAKIYAQSIVNTVREPLIVLDADLRVVTANRSFYRSFQLDPQQTEGRALDQVAGRQWNQPALRDLLERLGKGDALLEDVELVLELPDVGKTRWMVNARRLDQTKEMAPRILLAMEDHTGRAPL
jgi:two-component system CheB/CheR fusion protein